MPSDRKHILGIAVGGTFTDVLAFDRERGILVSAFKVPSTSDDPAAGAITGVDRYLERVGKFAEAVFHGTTVGTNALITKRAAKTALITTKGFRDVLALRRHARPRLYDLAPRISRALVPRERRFEAIERMGPDGCTIEPLLAEEIERLVAAVLRSGAEAVAISLLHSYANDEHERSLASAFEATAPELFVTLSSDVCREFREFERTSTATVNAFIGPPVGRYIDNLAERLGERSIAKLAIVKSNGGLTSAANARRHPVHLIESGPAAGIIAAAALGASEGLGNLIAFDMGGTTAKVGVVIDGKPSLSTEFYADRFVDGVDVGGYPIQSPVIDLIEIGAGGGSIAWIDAAGVIKVGPESAGASPGPACYGRGGERPTVTDAHAVLGHIAANGFGSEDLEIDPSLARSAVAEGIAKPLGWSVERAAWGILQLATANMSEMVRLATLRRGLDPRDFHLVAFGGAGPLHAAEIAREVGVPSVVVPQVPGLFSAIGTMLGDLRHDLVQTYLRRLDDIMPGELDAVYNELKRRAYALIDGEDGVADWQFERSIDARFEGQLFELNLKMVGEAVLLPDQIETAFRNMYREQYGYDLADHAVQIVNLRLVASSRAHDGLWPETAFVETSAHTSIRNITAPNSEFIEVPVYPREIIPVGQVLAGPLIIEDFGATIRVLDGQIAKVEQSGTLFIMDKET